MLNFRKRVKKSIKTHTDKLLYNEKVVQELLEHVHYHTGHYDQMGDFEALAEQLSNVHNGKKVYNLAFFAVPPVVFKPIVENLSHIKKQLKGGVNLMLEKPFGHNRKSAEVLFDFVHRHFKKEELFLIDHYLGKAAVRSIFPLRYNNAILDLLLKGHAISNIQINALETLGVDERIGFFENVGIIKDMIQSHLLQILALITMPIPVHQEVRSIRREKGDVIASLRLDSKQGVVLGQYKGYRDQDGVKKNSKTPTFAALRFFIDLAEWVRHPHLPEDRKKPVAQTHLHRH